MATIDKNEPVRIKSNGLLPSEIELEPDHIREQSFDPDLIHTLSLLAGYDGQHEHVVQVNADGKIAISTAPPSVLHYEVVRGTYSSTTPSGANVILSDVGSEIDLSISDNPIRIRLKDSVTGAFGDYIDLPVSDVEIPMVTNQLMIWCSVSGSSSSVQLVSWR